MLIDHAGLLLFDGADWMRWVGRLAMPLFAFFIGEGCRYTRSRKKYFLSVFLLGAGCQLVYILEELFTTGRLTAGSDAWYMNILLTFSLAIPPGFMLTDLMKAVRAGEKAAAKKAGLRLFAALSVIGAGAACLALLRGRGWALCFDYGVFGVILPLTTLLFDEKYKKTAAFACGVLLFCCCTAGTMPYVWFSLAAPALLLLYNGQSGSKKLKYGFYVFYPAHLAALYVIHLIFF